MNHLAHACLSFKNPDILIGNLIADSIRGKQIYDFREEIQNGIRLHRLIDEYTDRHPVVRELKDVFTQTAGRYNASFLDISFDHFLALDESNQPEEGWESFAQWCYLEIEKRLHELPDNFHRLFHYMKKDNWLYNYRYGWLIKKSFEKLTERAAFLDNNINVYRDFETNYDIIKSGYEDFFPQLKKFVLDISPSDKQVGI